MPLEFSQRTEGVDCACSAFGRSWSALVVLLGVLGELVELFECSHSSQSSW